VTALYSSDFRERFSPTEEKKRRNRGEKEGRIDLKKVDYILIC